MHKREMIIFLVLILLMLACSLSDYIPAPAPVIEPTALPTFGIPSETPVPTQTSLPTATPTPTTPVAYPKELGVNCRYGPGEEWGIVSALPAGTTTEIVGRVSETTWWYVKDPLNPGVFCWLSAQVVDTAGNLAVIPIVEPPTASVTKVKVQADFTFETCSGLNPVTLTGSITTNGPATVTYHWEVGGHKQEIMADETIEFTEAGVKKITIDPYLLDCGTYFFALHVSSPNQASARQDLTVKAP